MCVCGIEFMNGMVLSWSMRGHVLSERTMDGSDGVSNDGHLAHCSVQVLVQVQQRAVFFLGIQDS